MSSNKVKINLPRLLDLTKSYQKMWSIPLSCSTSRNGVKSLQPGGANFFLRMYNDRPGLVFFAMNGIEIAFIEQESKFELRMIRNKENKVILGMHGEVIERSSEKHEVLIELAGRIGSRAMVKEECFHREPERVLETVQ